MLAETLDPVQLAEVIDDPYERAYLARIQPEPAFGPTGPPLARETMAHLMRADEPDEMLWRRVSLIMELDNARDTRPAPSPGGEWRGFEPSGYGRAPEPDVRADAGSVPANAASDPASVSVPEPDLAPVPVPVSVPASAIGCRDGSDPDSVHVPTDVAKPALGLLARIGLRRRVSKATGRQ